MSRSVSLGRLRQLETAVRVLVSPLDHEDARAWGTSVATALRDLLGADKGTFAASRAGQPTWVTNAPDDVLDAYVRHYGALDVGQQRVNERGIRVLHQWMVLEPDELFGSAYYHEFFGRYGLHDAMGLFVHPPGEPAQVTFHHPRPLDEPAVRTNLALLRAAYPAFAAGVSIWRAAVRGHSDLLSFVDALGDAVVVCGAEGDILHTNPAAARLIESEAEAARLRQEIRDLALCVGALAGRERRSAPDGVLAPVREVRTGQGALRLRASFAERLGVGPLVLVTMERGARPPPSDLELRSRYRLTPRELTVARLLAAGQSNKQISRQLGVSWYTARNHTERVLHKLGLHSRAGVASVLSGDAVHAKE